MKNLFLKKKKLLKLKINSNFMKIKTQGHTGFYNSLKKKKKDGQYLIIN